MTKKKAPEDLLKEGRKSTYNEEIAAEILHEIATTSDSLKTLCAKHKHFPGDATVWRWMYDHDNFARKYAIAKAQQATILVDEMLAIAKSSYNRDTAACNKLLIETNRWIASKLIPKLYGSAKEIDDLTKQNESMAKEIKALQAEMAEKYKRDY